MSQRRVAESLKEIEIACELEPLALLAHWNRAMMNYFARRYDDARKALVQAQELGPDFGLNYAMAARLHLQKRNCAEALAASEKQRSILGHARFVQPLVIVRCRSAEEGLAAVAEFERVGQPRGPSMGLAMVYAVLGDRERALDTLEKAASNPNDWMAYINVIPELDNLRSEPRFVSLVKKMGLEK
jgi:tetratricopeptide (TPR) repeat protein